MTPPVLELKLALSSLFSSFSAFVCICLNRAKEVIRALRRSLKKGRMRGTIHHWIESRHLHGKPLNLLRVLRGTIQKNRWTDPFLNSLFWIFAWLHSGAGMDSSTGTASAGCEYQGVHSTSSQRSLD